MIWPNISFIKVNSFPPFLIPYIIKSIDESSACILDQKMLGSSAYIWLEWAGMIFKVVAYFDVVQSITMVGGTPTDEYTFAIIQGGIKYPIIEPDRGNL